ncbi:DUF4258 domain-containing protein [uncultured Brevibacillus sp.]|uniref:DUF4258 domain-containing protein n=1 Tax=uncultured Brevibacillus sp. TaxID=169970 RepID=UPI002599EE3B|nr:DUF4258 domain-containing protein [uncultured Brevibacillus sp.]
MKKVRMNRSRNEWYSQLLQALSPNTGKRIVLSHHIFETKRCYSKRDIASCLVTGECIGWSDDNNQIVNYDTGEAVIIGRDSSDQQMVLIVANAENSYVVITAFPPLDESKYGCSVA